MHLFIIIIRDTIASVHGAITGIAFLFNEFSSHCHNRVMCVWWSCSGGIVVFLRLLHSLLLLFMWIDSRRSKVKSSQRKPLYKKEIDSQSVDIPKRGAKNDFLTRLISQIPSKSIRPQSVAFLSPLSLSLSLCCSAVTMTTCGEIRHYLHYLCSLLVPCSREWNKQRSTSSNGNCCGYSGKFCGDYGVSQMRSIFLPTKPQLPRTLSANLNDEEREAEIYYSWTRRGVSLPCLLRWNNNNNKTRQDKTSGTPRAVASGGGQGNISNQE